MRGRMLPYIALKNVVDWDRHLFIDIISMSASNNSNSYE